MEEQAPYTTPPMPAAWCNARRAEIQAYVDGDARRNAQETRTMLLELLAQLKQAERESADERHETIHAEQQLQQARRELAAREVALEAEHREAASLWMELTHAKAALQCIREHLGDENDTSRQHALAVDIPELIAGVLGRGEEALGQPYSADELSQLPF